MESLEKAVGLALVTGILLSCGILAYMTGEAVTPEMLDRWVNSALIVAAVFAVSVVLGTVFLLAARMQVKERAYDVEEVRAAATMARLASQQGRLLQTTLGNQPGTPQVIVLGGESGTSLPPPGSGQVVLGGGDLAEPPDGRDRSDFWTVE